MIDALWRRLHKLRRPLLKDVYNEENKKFWPESFQPSAKELYNLRKQHQVDFDALVLERKPIALGHSR